MPPPPARAARARAPRRESPALTRPPSPHSAPPSHRPRAQSWAEKVLKHYKKFKGTDKRGYGEMEAEEIQSKYVETVRDHPLYGTNFFHVKKNNFPEQMASFPKLCIIALNSEGLHFLNEEFETLSSFGYADIYRWGGSSTQFSIIIWNPDTQDTDDVSMYTSQAADMAALILDYINAIMVRRAAAAVLPPPTLGTRTALLPTRSLALPPARRPRPRRLKSPPPCPRRRLVRRRALAAAGRCLGRAFARARLCTSWGAQPCQVPPFFPHPPLATHTPLFPPPCCLSDTIVFLNSPSPETLAIHCARQAGSTGGGGGGWVGGKARRRSSCTGACEEARQPPLLSARPPRRRQRRRRRRARP